MANDQGAKVRPVDAAIDLCAVVDRHLLTGQQSDAAAEERKHIQVGGQAEAKVEDVGAFEKEGSFFRKEKWKPRQVYLTRIDFGLGEGRWIT